MPIPLEILSPEEVALRQIRQRIKEFTEEVVLIESLENVISDYHDLLFEIDELANTKDDDGVSPMSDVIN